MKRMSKIILALCISVLFLQKEKASAQVDSVLNYVDSIVHWKVPCGVTQVTITAVGATGGMFIGYTPVGGKGAKMVGTFTVTTGAILKVLVGGVGQDGGGGGGGGGGSFVTDNSNNPLIIAGGGGGASGSNNAFVTVGIDAITADSGVTGNSALGNSPSRYGIGGRNGNGATNASGGGPCAGNGGGLLTGGQSANCCSLTTPGQAFINGGAGGIDGGCYNNGQGGFGGGGSGAGTGGGGGGGYSGGGGSWDNPTNGGGGGSFNGGTSQTNTGAYNASGDGQVIIHYTIAPLVANGNVVSNELCHGDSNAMASAIVSGGGTPYTYAWAPKGGTNDTTSGLTPGTYTVTVTDACGGSATASVSLTQPASLGITPHSTPDDGSSDGTAYVTVTGGTMPFTYAWTGGNTTDSIFGKAHGTYCCKVTDANGCIDSTCINIASSLGVNNVINTSGVSVYPDPNNGNFTVAGVAKGQVIELYNYMGQKLNSVIADNSNAVHFNISNMDNGIYLVRILNSDGKLVSERKIEKAR